MNHPEQIKSAETTTYDDEGNVIPLSKRFNKRNADIRYAKAEEDIDKTADKITSTAPIEIGEPDKLSSDDKAIYDIFKNKKEGWRRKIADWALSKLPKSTKTSFGEVEYRHSKIRGSLSHGFGDLKMLTLPYLDKMFKDGVLYDKHTEDDGFTYYNVAHRLTYQGEDYIARLVAREDRQGNLFYDHEFTDIKKNWCSGNRTRGG